MNNSLHFRRKKNSLQGENAYRQLATQALYQHNLLWAKDSRLHRIKGHDKTISLMHEIAVEFLIHAGALVELENFKVNQVRLHLKPLMARLKQALSTDFGLMKEEYRLHKPSPVLALAWRIRPFIATNVRYELDRSYSPEEGQAVLKYIERVIAVARRRLKRKAFKLRQKNFQRNAIENFISLSQAIDWLAQRHLEVVALRFDLFQRPPGSQPAHFGDVPNVGALDEFTDCCERFQRFMVHRFGEDLLGYAWTLEYGREAGFHKHYVVFLRPRGNEDHAGVVDGLEAKWVTLAEGGYMHNCNRKAHTYSPRAIGLVRLDDPQVIEGLRFIVVYFTLAALFVKLDVKPDKFGKGCFPDGPLDSGKAGRPKHIKRGEWARRAIALAQSQYLNFM